MTGPAFSKWLLLGLVLLASSARGEAEPRELSVGAGTFTYLSFLRSSPSPGVLELAYHQSMAPQGFWRALRVGGGIRATLPGADTPVPVEAFVRAQLTFRYGPWEPTAGPELGLSGLAHLERSDDLPAAELFQQEDARLGPLYVAFGAAPLRFRFGRFVVSALELHLGVSAPPMGAVTRLQLGLLSFGFSL